MTEESVEIRPTQQPAPQQTDNYAIVVIQDDEQSEQFTLRANIVNSFAENHNSVFVSSQFAASLLQPPTFSHNTIIVP